MYISVDITQNLVSSNKMNEIQNAWMYFDHFRKEGFSTYLQLPVLECAAISNSLPISFIQLRLGLFIAMDQEHLSRRARHF